MACIYPKHIKNPRYKYMSDKEIEEYGLKNHSSPSPPDLYIDVGCGKCEYCQKRRLNDYRIRLNYELAEHPNSLFVTLSFCDDALEEYKQDYNLAVRQFLDALRKHFGKNIRHWFICEFGTEHGRPHYHGLLFDIPYIPFEEFESLWNRGNGKRRNIDKDDFVGYYRKPRGIIWIDSVRETTVNYLVKYMTKDYNPNVIPPRVLSSRGIGLGYLTEFNISLHNGKYKKPYISYRDYNVPLPQYYKNKIYSAEDKVAIVNQSVENPPNIFFNGETYLVGDLSLPLEARIAERMRYQCAVEYYKATQSIYDSNTYPCKRRKYKNHNSNLFSFVHLFHGPIVQKTFNFNSVKLCH